MGFYSLESYISGDGHWEVEVRKEQNFTNEEVVSSYKTRRRAKELVEELNKATREDQRTTIECRKDKCITTKKNTMDSWKKRIHPD